jgi:DNA-binding response OmpR family regulator
MINVTRVEMSLPRKILIVDDDELLCESIVEQFALFGDFDASAVNTAREGLAALKGELFDLVILDVGLPDMDGRDGCMAMRHNGYAGPVIMLTGQCSDADTILGLESGANDYVAKPFAFSVLLARIRAHLRQHEHSEAAVFKIGPCTFWPSLKLLVRDDRKVHLTEMEASVLKFLYRCGQRAVGRDTLLREVWGYSPGATTHTVETHIYRLRQKIELNPSCAEILVTEDGGYRLLS